VKERQAREDAVKIVNGAPSRFTFVIRLLNDAGADLLIAANLMPAID